MSKKASINKLQKKEGRGILLTIILVIFLLYSLNLLYSFFAFTMPDTWSLIKEVVVVGKIPPVLSVSASGSVSRIVIAAEVAAQYVTIPLHIAIFIGILKWKKIAIYGFFLLPMIEVIYNNLFVLPKPTILLTLLGILTGFFFVYTPLSIFFFAFRRKWYLFK